MLQTENQKKMCLDGLYRINKKPLVLNLKPRKNKTFLPEGISMDGVRVAPYCKTETLLRKNWRREGPMEERCGNEEKRRKKWGKMFSVPAGYFSDVFERVSQGMTLVRMWNVSIVSAVIFGMFLMTMIYRYLGQSAQAGTGKVVLYPENGAIEREIEKGDLPYVLGEVSEVETQKENGEDYAKKIIFEHKQKVEKNQKKAELEKEIRKMVKGYPMEKMAPYIAEKDRTTAAFFVAMAKKESNWGKNVPVLAGQDCFNYLGYKGIRARMGSGGHTCFDSAQDAVNTISKRIDYLVKQESITTPEKMVTVWKCGYDCSWDDPAAVKKWVSDVKMYFDELKPGKNK